ncbi:MULTISPECIES: chitosanase [unclassified Streptomyces]|uniref:chitosanase n=1 Tax=unclassified Streptomyces TaxID=2593676 RepID=UPI00036B8A1D|nr:MULTISPECIES: chitosanase [unclassified Streptomyces]MYQ76459.1 chitosanase [Streptomyces sp. SID4923]
MKLTPRALVTPLAALLMSATTLTGCAQAGGSSGKGPADGLATPAKKDIAMQLVSSAENSTLDWKAQYEYIEDIGDGRGYTGGIIGFCSGTGDMLRVVERYAKSRPGNALERFLPALRKVKGSDAHTGLGSPFTRAWAEAAKDARFREAQDAERDASYFDPAVRRAKEDGLGTLGQFVYYDAYVMHGEADAEGTTGFRTIRSRALDAARAPADGGDETAYLDAFLDARVDAIREEPSHSDTSRVETAQRVFLDRGNLDLDPPLAWKVYGDSYEIKRS